jgi:DNA polymerase-3 subunit delta
LESEGEAVNLAVWQLSEDLHALAHVLRAVETGTPLGVAVRNARVWGRRQNALERAARRVKPETLTPLIAGLARLDGLAKGIGLGSAWETLQRTAMVLCGVATPASLPPLVPQSMLPARTQAVRS